MLLFILEQHIALVVTLSWEYRIQTILRKHWNRNLLYITQVCYLLKIFSKRRLSIVLWKKEVNLLCCSLANPLNEEKPVGCEFCAEIAFPCSPGLWAPVKGWSRDTALFTKSPTGCFRQLWANCYKFCHSESFNSSVD